MDPIETLADLQLEYINLEDYLNQDNIPNFRKLMSEIHLDQADAVNFDSLYSTSNSYGERLFDAYLKWPIFF